MNKIILYIATSFDGFIADINGGVDWLPHPKDHAELEAVGYKDLMERIDTILMGSRSYKQILSFGDWGWPDKQTYVFTSGQLETDKPYISITHDNPFEFMAKFKDRTSDKDIWLLGGAELAKSFAQEGLLNEVILTIIPQTLGEGIPLGLTFEKFDLTAEKALTDGMMQKIYSRKNT
ncbi:riboflavin-specific deaminase C-terminal domain [Legionella pneumophila]|uniref:dihydrofolate reductase family protein n=1 Tax=Legionella pneumophila TaxID=446 RepID=UPI000770A309|nr:dihydrofolate reductase family protein [Legionella pneumophila]CZP95250.1 riboflavin-specific deaminase C-terminal domain [Legionella pneumophila]